MSLALLFHYLMLDMFRMLVHPSSGACDLFVELFHGLYCSGSMCVGVTLWFGWGGVVSGCRLQPFRSLSGVRVARCYTDTTQIPAAPNLQHTTSREHNNQCGNSTALLQAPVDGYINVRNMLST